MSTADMQEFWDERAREDAFYFVDDGLVYRKPDEQRFWARGAQALDAIFAMLEIEPAATDTVLDIGCGLGRLSREMARRCAEVVALDVSCEMLDRAAAANSHLHNITWVHGDGTSLAGVQDESIDLVVSHVVFQHIPDPAITLGYVREIGRILRSGGLTAFHVSNDPVVHRPRGRRRVRDELAHRTRDLLGRAPGGQRHPAWLGSAVDLDELGEAAQESGMAVEKIVGEGTQYCFVRLRRDAA